jgi:membrane-associated phospholipid phosphatase
MTSLELKMAKWPGFVALLALQVVSLSAQVPAVPTVQEVEIKTLPKRFVGDELKLWASPFRRASYSSHTVKKYVIPFALISAALIASDRQIAGALPNTPAQVRWGGRFSQLGASYSIAGLAGSTYLFGKFSGDDHVREAGLLSLEALGHVQIVGFAIKQLTNRERPMGGDGRGGFWEGGNAFPSGHVSSAFAVATVFAYEYRDHIAVPITAFSVASLISASRAAARKHWASDIFVAGTLGFMVGRFTYKRNHNPRLPGSKVSRTDRLIPQIGFAPGGASLSWAF